MTTQTHKLYNMALFDHDRLPVVAYGSAGTGKTYGAVNAAMQGLEGKKFKTIIVTRPNVSFAKENGFLPGTDREKMAPWVRPIEQCMDELGYKANYRENLEKNGKLWFVPLEHIQGLTFHNAFIIVDEVQNMSFEQLRVFVSRQGRFSKIVLCGDIAQTSPMFHKSGLAEFLKMAEALNMRLHSINFTPEDIVRSPECKAWIEAFEAWDEMKAKEEL